MHAFLIIGEVEEYLNNIDGTKIEFPFAKVFDFRELNNFVRLKLVEKTAIILKDFDKATEEAQNAFLKALEEPQDNLTYILTASNIDAVLSTIVSRCEVVQIQNSKFKILKEDREKIEKFINGEVGEKINAISKITKRDEAIFFMKNIILVGHEEILDSEIPVFNLLDEALVTLKNLEANGNVTLQLANFVVNTS